MHAEDIEPRLPAGDVERIFQQLRVIYGADFAARWRGADFDEVRASWAERLAHFSRAQLDWALQNLPERAPNVVQFAALCAQAPAPSVSAQDFLDDAPPPSPEQRARIHALCAAAFRRMGEGARADAAAAAAAEAAEEARDDLAAQGLGAAHLAALQDEADEALAAAREQRIARETARYPQRAPDGKPWQFDLAALLRRAGTAAEQPRDWARIIAARYERGCREQTGYARRVAMIALQGREHEGWTRRRRAAPAAAGSAGILPSAAPEGETPSLRAPEGRANDYSPLQAPFAEGGTPSLQEDWCAAVDAFGAEALPW